MTHARQQIREAAATVLRVSPTAWGQVFETRIPTARAIMPYLMLFADGETIAPGSVNLSDVHQREISLVVAGRLRLPGNNVGRRRTDAFVRDMEHFRARGIGEHFDRQMRRCAMAWRCISQLAGTRLRQRNQLPDVLHRQ